MNISAAADHGAWELKDALVRYLRDKGHTVLDRGASGPPSVDYPDFAKLVCLDVREGRAERGLLLCTSGLGMSMAANKYSGIRAALVHSEDDARYARMHNDANIIVFGSRHHTYYEASSYLDIFLGASFEGGRHERRVRKMAEAVPLPPSNRYEHPIE